MVKRKSSADLELDSDKSPKHEGKDFEKTDENIEIEQNLSPDKNEKIKRRTNRFNGISEEEIAATRSLPDYIRDGLDILFIGINPGLVSAYKGHYYSSPGNHFWKSLYLSGLVPNPTNPADDHRLLDVGFGFTDVVKRATRKSAELSKSELIEGSLKLKEKLVKFQPKIAVFNGKYIYEVFSGQKSFYLVDNPKSFPALTRGYGLCLVHLLDVHSYPV